MYKDFQKILNNLPPSTSLDAIFKNPEFIKMAESTLRVLKDFEQKVDERQEAKTQEKSNDLVKTYSGFINRVFQHTETGNQYILLDIVNTQSSKLDQFPVTAIYFDIQLQTKWSRNLIDFSSKFTLVG